jgi:hypothetical protein
MGRLVRLIYLLGPLREVAVNLIFVMDRVFVVVETGKEAVASLAFLWLWTIHRGCWVGWNLVISVLIPETPCNGHSVYITKSYGRLYEYTKLREGREEKREL